jgi:hypothetical protein
MAQVLARNGPIWIPIFIVLPKHSQFVDHSMIVSNYSLNQFKYDFKRKFQCSIQNTKEYKILSTFGNSFHSFISQKGIVFS